MRYSLCCTVIKLTCYRITFRAFSCINSLNGNDESQETIIKHKKRIFQELRQSEGDKWVSESVSLAGTYHSVMSSRHRNIRFGRMSIIQRVHFPGRWVHHLFIYEGILGVICPAAFGTQIRVIGEKWQGTVTETVNYLLQAALTGQEGLHRHKGVKSRPTLAETTEQAFEWGFCCEGI